ncbi:type VI secretion system-associated protein TagF [Roseateles amylovorans]|uniref:Type VI secretion system-associated protein TagF n=1 Tax=Roseateles amylovorans TaxID=2978473 RepID=A0ABY6ASD5_9BURK|nr:type VI secretion system-associated protein TagF [Roseateles amylovorans]UXH76141.1 type VI secretion system-associated protein TagF [Roseateles amylovorans]
MKIAWFGKLPALGDFVHRRLDIDTLERLDAWLSDGLTQRIRAAPEHWLDAYDRAPRWRFAWASGVLMTKGLWSGPVCGVLLPSRDRVGRRFPLIALRPMTAPMSPAAHEWLSGLESVLCLAVSEAWSVAQLEASLALLDSIAPLHADRAAVSHGRPPPGRTFWAASPVSAGEEPTWSGHRGLPAGPAFARLITAPLDLTNDSGEGNDPPRD